MKVSVFERFTTGVGCRPNVLLPRLYLTFDDGPDPEVTPALLDLLAEHNSRACFFLLGRQVKRYPELTRRIYRAGHSVGNHTWNHRHPWLLSKRALAWEMSATTALLEDTLAAPIALFRPPYGRVRRAMLEEAKRLAQTTVLWNLSSRDWGRLGTEKRILRRLQRAENRTIILLHDSYNKRNRPAAMLAVLPEFLAARRLQGYRFDALLPPERLTIDRLP